jgi:DNA-binding transcriptional MerR regulator/effector-binding domain-containing protein
MKSKEVFSIGEVAKITGINAKTLRFYDRIQLLSPSFRNETNNYRCYTEDHIVTLLIIKNFRTMGFGLKDIHEMINKKDTSTIEKEVRKRMDTIREQINSLEDQYSMGEDLLARLHYRKERGALEQEIGCPHTSDPSQDIHIETIDEITLLFHREVIHSYKNSELSLWEWSNIMMEPQNNGLHKCGAYIVTFYTEPLSQFLMSTCDVEFGVPVEVPADYKSDDAYIRTFGGFRAATAVHAGPYSGIINTHVKLLQLINQNGYAVAGPISEEFIISHMDINNIDEHITKVIVPIRTAE